MIVQYWKFAAGFVLAIFLLGPPLYIFHDWRVQGLMDDLDIAVYRAKDAANRRCENDKEKTQNAAKKLQDKLSGNTALLNRLLDRLRLDPSAACVPIIAASPE